MGFSILFVDFMDFTVHFFHSIWDFLFFLEKEIEQLSHCLFVCTSSSGVSIDFVILSGKPEVNWFIDFVILSGKPEVNWLANGKPIPDSDDFKYQNAGDIYKLIVGEIFPEDAGVYTCTASNAGGTASSSATIFVKGTVCRCSCLVKGTVQGCRCLVKGTV